MKVKISLAGMPGVGKTQTLLKTIDILEKEGNVVGGILTEKVIHYQAVAHLLYAET